MRMWSPLILSLHVVHCPLHLLQPKEILLCAEPVYRQLSDRWLQPFMLLLYRCDVIKLYIAIIKRHIDLHQMGVDVAGALTESVL